MKHKCLLAVHILLFMSGLLSAQTKLGESQRSNRLHSTGIACIYDFSKSMTETIYDPQSDTTVRYFYASSDTSSFSMTEAHSADELLSSLCSWNDLLIFVHGYGEGLTKRIFRDQLLTSIYNVDVIVFYWPSDMNKKGDLVSYKNTKENMANTFPLFERFLSDVAQYVKKHGIHCSLMFSSLGNRYAMMLGERYASNEQEIDLSFVDNLILNQACVPFTDYEKWAFPLSEQISGKLYVTYNKRDAVLGLAERAAEHRRLLGQGPNSGHSYISSPNIEYINFTEMVKNWGAKSSHNFYIHHPKRVDPQIVFSEYRKLLE